LPIGAFANEAIIADHLSHNRAIFLLSKTLIVFQRRASPRERNLFLFAIGNYSFIDEFSTVIGIDPQNRKGEERSRALEGCQHRLLTHKEEGTGRRRSDAPWSFIVDG